MTYVRKIHFFWTDGRVETLCGKYDQVLVLPAPWVLTEVWGFFIYTDIYGWKTKKESEELEWWGYLRRWFARTNRCRNCDRILELRGITPNLIERGLGDAGGSMNQEVPRVHFQGLEDICMIARVLPILGVPFRGTTVRDEITCVDCRSFLAHAFKCPDCGKWLSERMSYTECPEHDLDMDV